MENRSAPEGVQSGTAGGAFGPRVQRGGVYTSVKYACDASGVHLLLILSSLHNSFECTLTAAWDVYSAYTEENSVFLIWGSPAAPPATEASAGVSEAWLLLPVTKPHG